MAHSPALGSLGDVQMTTVARHQLEPDEDGHVGTHGQARKPRGQAEAGHLQPGDQGRPGVWLFRVPPVMVKAEVPLSASPDMD